MAKAAPVKHVKLSPEQISAIEARAFDLVLPYVQAPLYLLAVGVEKEGSQWLLQIFIERLNERLEEAGNPPQGISLQDCEQVSRALNEQWDAIDANLQKELPGLSEWSYSLEVSSPGLFRPLKTKREFEFYQGRPVRAERVEPVMARSKNPNNKLSPNIKLSIAQKKAPIAIEVANGVLDRFDESSKTVFITTGTNETKTVQLDNQTQVLLNPVIRLEDEDSVPVSL